MDKIKITEVIVYKKLLALLVTLVSIDLNASCYRPNVIRRMAQKAADCARQNTVKANRVLKDARTQALKAKMSPTVCRSVNMSPAKLSPEAAAAVKAELNMYQQELNSLDAQWEALAQKADQLAAIREAIIESVTVSALACTPSLLGDQDTEQSKQRTTRQSLKNRWCTNQQEKNALRQTINDLKNAPNCNPDLKSLKDKWQIKRK